MTTEIIPREKCRVCKIYLQKNCLNDICIKCSARRMYVIQLHEESILNECDLK